MIALGLVFRCNDITIKYELLASRNECDLEILSIYSGHGEGLKDADNVLIENRPVHPCSDFPDVAAGFCSK